MKSSLVITYTMWDLRVVTSSRKYTPYRTIILSYDLLCNGKEIVTITNYKLTLKSVVRLFIQQGPVYYVEFSESHINFGRANIAIIIHNSNSSANYRLLR